MLIEFSVANFRSFNDRKTLSLIASPGRERAQTNIVRQEGYRFLRSAVIYGDNAAGKSNFITAMTAMRTKVLQGYNPGDASMPGFIPFMLQTADNRRPSLFEAVFLMGGLRYRYGFEADHACVQSEWLLRGTPRAEELLFTRGKDGIRVTGAFPEGKKAEKETPDDMLLLAVADQMKGEIAGDILYWFNNMLTISALDHARHRVFTYNLMEEADTRSLLKGFYRKAGIGMEDVKLGKRQFDASSIPADIPDALAREVTEKLEGRTMVEVTASHKKFNRNHKPSGRAVFDLDSREGEGCNKLFSISGPVFDVLEDGGVLAVDEFDQGLHPRLTTALVRLFYSEKYNPRNAQLIFTTRDSHLVSGGNYRRDQIWLMEKDAFGASDLYALANYADQALAKDLVKGGDPEKTIPGRHGTIPFIRG